MVSPPQPWALADRGTETGDEAAVPQVREVCGQVHDHGEHGAWAGGGSGVGGTEQGHWGSTKPGHKGGTGMGCTGAMGLESWDGTGQDTWMVMGQHQTGTSGWHWHE